MLATIECECGHTYQAESDSRRTSALCTRCGRREPFPRLDADTRLLHVSPRVWKVLCSCEQKLKLPREMTGRRFQCPRCNKMRRVPAETRAMGGTSMMNDVTVITNPDEMASPPLPGGRRRRLRGV